MSLLVVNSGSKVAQGFIRAFNNAQTFEKIICADLYPNYAAIKNFLDFKGTIEPKTQLIDKKILDKQDMQDLAKQADHVLFVQHNYYKLVPHKVQMMTNAFSLPQFKNYKKVVYVAPAEYDHAQEQDSNGKWKEAEATVRNTIPQLTGIRADFTFGQDSCIANTLLGHIYHGKGLYFKSLAASHAPINTADLAKIVQKVMSDSSTEGKTFLAQGPRSVEWQTFFKVLERALGENYNLKLNDSSLENVITPTSNNLLTELLYDSEYRNLVQLINNSRGLHAVGYESAAQLLTDKLTDMEEYYKQNPVNRDQVAKCRDFVERLFSS